MLARLSAQRFGRPVRPDEIERALIEEGMDPGHARLEVETLAQRRWAYPVGDGLLPSSIPRKSRAQTEVASFAWLHR